MIRSTHGTGFLSRVPARGPRDLLPLVAALLAATASAQAAASQSGSNSVAPVPSGGPTTPVGAPRDASIAQPDAQVHECGLGAAFHAGRRKKLVEALRAISPTGLVLVRGLPATREYTRFTQDKTFWYLTGVESPDAALVVDVKSGAETLFLPPRSAASERWEGELWDAQDAWVKDVTGFTDVRPTNELVPMLKETAPAAKVVWISKEPWIELSGCADRARENDKTILQDPLDGRLSREDALELNLRQKVDVDVRDCAPVLAEMRRVKTPEEISALRSAGRIGALAMEEAVRCSRPGRGEWELEAVMTFVQRREGATGPAYHAIVGCGPNALVLHYSADSRTMRAGEMVLLDYAPEVDHYTSDITRSWPVDGKFTPRMIEIYDAVLEAQLAGIAAVKPGATFEDVEKASRHALSTHGMFKLTRHGVSHYVGLEVHDVGDYRRPFEPGVVLTVEPGVYDAQANIGVRIEDVVVVTATGCEVLTAGVPKDRASLMALQSESGLLDRKPAIELLHAPIAVESPGKH
jgi:Xaa-Pro aminopeptidase